MYGGIYLRLGLVAVEITHILQKRREKQWKN